MTDWQNRIVGFEPAIEPDQLLANPLNARRHPGDQRDAIRASLDTLGWVDVVKVNTRTGRMLDGHMRTEEALSAGVTVPVLFLDLTEDEERRMLATLDPIAGMATYDADVLADLIDGLEFEDALQGLLAKIGDEATSLPPLDKPGEGPDDPAPEPPVEPVTQVGDIWCLRDHRLMCADALNTENLDALHAGLTPAAVITDPPYGINVRTDWTADQGFAGSPSGGKHHDPVLGDDHPFDATTHRVYYSSTTEQFWFGADYYRRSLSDDDQSGSWLVWDKRTEESDPGYGSGFELIWSANRHKRDLLRVLWFGAFSDDRAESRARLHPTQKPTRLLAQIMTRWTKPGSLIADPFAGSGSTILAAHEAGRICHAMELDPRYVDVAARRFQEATGEVPVLAATGEPYNFLETSVAVV